MPSKIAVPRPPMDERIRGPQGSSGRCDCFVVHTAEGCRDRICTIDFLASIGKSVPYSIDGDGITAMCRDGFLGYAHAGGLTGEASGAELAGFHYWSRKTWTSGEPLKMVQQAGQVGAYVLSKHGGYAITEDVVRYRIIGHAQDERFGGTSDHVDPGDDFPYDVCWESALAWAGKEDELMSLFDNIAAFRNEVRGAIVGWEGQGNKRAPALGQGDIRRGLEFQLGQDDAIAGKERPKEEGPRQRGWDLATKVLKGKP